MSIVGECVSVGVCECVGGVCVNVNVNMCMYMCQHVHVYVCVHMCVCLCACLSVCMYVIVYLCKFCIQDTIALYRFCTTLKKLASHTVIIASHSMSITVLQILRFYIAFYT